jgi:hypothetical protein
MNDSIIGVTGLMKKRRMVPAVILALLATAAVRADLMPLSPSNTSAAGMSPSRLAEERGTEGENAGRSQACAFLSFDSPSFSASYVPTFSPVVTADELGVLPLPPLCDLRDEVEEAGGTPSVRILAEGQSSFALCLYGLLGFGAFRSLSCVRKVSLGAIPDWYHAGAPAQIGHSFALTPDCRCSTPEYCFVQPDTTPSDCQPRYYQGTITSLWRKSQFIPTLLASRGPPHRIP